MKSFGIKALLIFSFLNNHAALAMMQYADHIPVIALEKKIAGRDGEEPTSASIVIHESLGKLDPFLLEKALRDSGCDHWGLKDRVKMGGDFFSPLIHVLAMWNSHSASYEQPYKIGLPQWHASQQIKLDILLRYGFHLSVEYFTPEWYSGFLLSKKIVTDPRFFGAFHRQQESIKRGMPASLALHILAKRKAPLFDIIPKDIHGLLINEVSGAQRILEDHLACVKKFHVLPELPAQSSKGRVGDWSIDITYHDIKDKIGSDVVRKFYEIAKGIKSPASLSAKTSPLDGQKASCVIL